MSNIATLSNLYFFKVGKYEYKNRFVCDFSDCPRPHFCMGLIIKGEGVFESEAGCVHVKRGDIIFVPIASKYVSTWTGTPDILYISMHFSFEAANLFTNQKDFKIQKVVPSDFDDMRSKFEYALENYNGSDTQRLSVLSIFYGVLSEIFPKLTYKNAKKIDERIEKAVEYIDFNYANEISVAELAQISNMSVPHFYSCFKSAVGLPPVEYRHKVCINHAILLLIGSDTRTVEEISEMLGFCSAAYFRRVFKKITGKSPREYRRTSIEL